jgi:hypothetical protein
MLYNFTNCETCRCKLLKTSKHPDLQLCLGHSACIKTLKREAVLWDTIGVNS